jgi:hypothetical protein
MVHKPSVQKRKHIGFSTLRHMLAKRMRRTATDEIQGPAKRTCEQRCGGLINFNGVLRCYTDVTQYKNYENGYFHLD